MAKSFTKLKFSSVSYVFNHKWVFNLLLSMVIFIFIEYQIFSKNEISVVKTNENPSKISSNNIKISHIKYDYIIVGAGTAGSIVASQLSKNPKINVLLIEEGGWSENWEIIKNAKLFYKITKEPQLERGYHTQPEPYLNNRIFHYSRAKMTGGCGNHNSMAYTLGNRKDFNIRWNVTNWKWKDIKKYWYHIENTYKTTLVDNKESKWIKEFILAGKNNGYPYNNDPNDLDNNGQFGVHIRIQSAVKINSTRAERVSSWTTYMEPVINRSNLDIMIYSRVNKVLFNEHKQAIGVEIYNIISRKISNIYANEEVILSAGSIDTPKILMLSGIGKCNELKELNIDCVSNVIGVGKNMEDHFWQTVISPPFKKRLQNVRTIKYPSKIFHLYGTLFFDNQSEYYNGLTIKIHQGKLALQSFFIPLHPKFRSEIKLKDKNPESKPLIFGNYLSNKYDEQLYLNAFKISRQLIYSPNLMKYYDTLEKEIKPGFNIRTDDEILQWGRDNLLPDGHASGSCKMGNNFDDSNIVVDNRLNVKGVKNLRIIDASIIPAIVSGNPNQVTMIIAFKGSDIVLEDYNNKNLK